MNLLEEPADLFRLYFWTPDKGLSLQEAESIAKAISDGNKAIDRLLSGEIEDDEFLDLIRNPYLISIDDYIQNVEQNLDNVEKGLIWVGQ